MLAALPLGNLFLGVLVVLPVLLVSATTPPLNTLPVRPCNLSDVRLHTDTFFGAAQAENTQYLQWLEPDRLLYNFRIEAGLNPWKASPVPYGGWIGNGSLVAGHFTGHFLSATAFAVAATGDALLAAKSKYMVAELALCQAHICQSNASMCGWLSAYSFSQMVALETHEGRTWATYYTMHKVIAGLLDTYTQTGNEQALDVVVKMTAFFKQRIDRVIQLKGWAWWEACLNVEFGGMNEAMFNLYAITGDPDHNTMATYFYKALFMDPLAQQHDSLNQMHANTHLPEIIGVARGWELTGNDTLLNITNFFYDTLSSKYSYATGGSNVDEHWQFPNQLGDAILTVGPTNPSTSPLRKSCAAGALTAGNDLYKANMTELTATAWCNNNTRCTGFTARSLHGCAGAAAESTMEVYFKTGGSGGNTDVGWANWRKPTGTKAVDSNGFHTEESCTQYNALKIVRHMFQWNPTAVLADDYERKLLNGVLGIQQPLHNGTMIYMTPLGKGVARTQANWDEGWGTPNASFWCCYGTAIESFAKLGDSIYFKNTQPGSTPQLWVAQYISSDLRWAEAGLLLSQRASYTPDSTALNVTITLSELPKASGLRGNVTIHVRLPSWAVRSSTTVSVNGLSVVAAGTAHAGSFLSISGAFTAGDVIDASFGMEAWLDPLNVMIYVRPVLAWSAACALRTSCSCDTYNPETLNDYNRTEYSNVAAIMYGPLLLAGLTETPTFALIANKDALRQWLVVHPGMKFTAPGNWTLHPLNRIVNQPYTAYFNISTTAIDLY